MSYIKRKLNDDKGISILFALLLLLVTAMVCTVIVSASLSSAKRTNSRIAATQETTLMDSAALYIKKEILDATSDIRLTYNDKSGVYSISSSISSDFSNEIEELTLAYMNNDTNYLFSEGTSNSFEIITEYDGNKNVINVQYGYKDVGSNTASAIFKLSNDEESKMYIVFSITHDGNKVSWLWDRAKGNGI